MSVPGHPLKDKHTQTIPDKISTILPKRLIFFMKTTYGRFTNYLDT